MVFGLRILFVVGQRGMNASPITIGVCTFAIGSTLFHRVLHPNSEKPGDGILQQGNAPWVSIHNGPELVKHARTGEELSSLEWNALFI